MFVEEQNKERPCSLLLFQPLVNSSDLSSFELSSLVEHRIPIVFCMFGVNSLINFNCCTVGLWPINSSDIATCFSNLDQVCADRISDSSYNDGGFVFGCTNNPWSRWSYPIKTCYPCHQLFTHGCNFVLSPFSIKA